MALPWQVDPAIVQQTDSPGLGPQDFGAIWQALADMFGVPIDTPIFGSILTLGANTDGRVATLPVVKASQPFLRMIGSELSGQDIRVREATGVLAIERNTSVDPIQSFIAAWSFDMTAATQGAAFTQANTAGRTYSWPDKDGTVAMVSDIGNLSFPAGTRIAFFQASPPTGWTRVVDAPNTDSVIRLVTNGEVPGTGGSWTVTGLTTDAHTHPVGSHQHDSPVAGPTGGGIGGAGYIAVGGPWPHGTGGTYLMSNAGWNGSDISIPALLTGPGTGNTGSTSPPVSSDASWRPKYVDALIGQKT